MMDEITAGLASIIAATSQGPQPFKSAPKAVIPSVGLTRLDKE